MLCVRSRAGRVVRDRGFRVAGKGDFRELGVQEIGLHGAASALGRIFGCWDVKF